MKDELARSLLPKVVTWPDDQVRNNITLLRNFADYKYDDYEQFYPGRRFMESFSNWLNNFRQADRTAAFEFVRDRLIFFSRAEINHLVTMSFPYVIRPRMLQDEAKRLGLKRFQWLSHSRTLRFQARIRKSLFLGLSDGARIDVFRRSSSLSHEQIERGFDLPDDKIGEMQADLKRDLDSMQGIPAEERKPVFNYVFLLDDFTASGATCLRRDVDGTWKGKLARFHLRIQNPKFRQALDFSDGGFVGVVHYLATEHALRTLQARLDEMASTSDVPYRLMAVQVLPDSVKVNPVEGSADYKYKPLIDHAYDESLLDESTKLGGVNDLRYGFASCGLPVVLAHNTPNNSIAILWAYEETDYPGLFPRVRRHKGVK